MSEMMVCCVEPKVDSNGEVKHNPEENTSKNNGIMSHRHIH
jgi:hypothetical protein